MLGPRLDRFKDENSRFISGHSVPLVSLGGFILIFGFCAFNAGSQVRKSIQHPTFDFTKYILRCGHPLLSVLF